MMFGGILCGYLVRKKQVIHIQRVTTLLIWALLFLLGLNIGSNQQIINSIGQVVVSGNANGRTAVNVSDLNGVYFLRIIADGDVVVRKITVK